MNTLNHLIKVNQKYNLPHPSGSLLLRHQWYLIIDTKYVQLFKYLRIDVFSSVYHVEHRMVWRKWFDIWYLIFITWLSHTLLFRHSDGWYVYMSKINEHFSTMIFDTWYSILPSQIIYTSVIEEIFLEERHTPKIFDNWY